MGYHHSPSFIGKLSDSSRYFRKPTVSRLWSPSSTKNVSPHVPGIPGYGEPGGNRSGHTTRSNPFVHKVLDACHTQGLSTDSEVVSTAHKWIELLQHDDTRSISNPQSNIDALGVLKTLGSGVSQRKKAKKLSFVVCTCLFSETIPLHTPVARGCNGQKKVMLIALYSLLEK
jgi:hypothetical protein